MKGKKQGQCMSDLQTHGFRSLFSVSAFISLGERFGEINKGEKEN